MNIGRIINPLIFGREGIDDRNWKLRASVTNSKTESIIRIGCQNTFLFRTKSGLNKLTTFTLVFFIDECGEFRFNRVTIGKNGALSQMHRMILKDDLYKLFIKPIEDQFLAGSLNNKFELYVIHQ